MAQSSGKKQPTKKTAVKKTAVKKTATTKKSAASKTANGTSKARKPSPASLRRQQAQAEEERAQYMRKIEANQSRLVSGNAADGTPLTPTQINATESILAAQQIKLAELDAFEESLAQIKAEEDPRLAQI